MHAEIFLAIMVLVVALLVAADFFRRASEGPHEHAERPAYDAGRAAFTPPGAPGTSRPAAAVTAFQPVGAGRAAAARTSPGTSPSRPGPGTGGAVPVQGADGVKGRWLVRTRLSLVAAASALAAAAATASFIRVADVMQGASYHSDVSSIRDGAAASAILAGVAGVVALAVGGWAAAILIRSVLRPLDQLRTGAVELADVRLPDALRGGGRGPLAVRSVGVASSDEIGQIGRAFDRVQAEVLGLTSNEAGLRGKLGEMFVELSTRSQALVERQIRLIDELEQGEQDAERLASLFKMDHIATRMRRYSQNLLVLAGHELPGDWNQPVALVDVIRAAASEIEDYERVSLNAQAGIAIAGPAVKDVVHLLAELAENATSLSAAGTPVDISGRSLASGGTLIDVTDSGVGMNPEVLAEANRRLDSPPAMDFAVSRNMGLFVVGRLAARHGIKVRLQPAAAGGLTALIWLPETVASGPDAPPDSRASDRRAPDRRSAGGWAAGDTAAGGTAFDGTDAGPGWGAHAAARSGVPAGTPGSGAPGRGPAEREGVTTSMWSAPVLEDVRPPAASPLAPAPRPGRHAWSDSGPQPSFRPHPSAFTQPPESASPPPASAAPVRTQPSSLPQRLVASPRPSPAPPSPSVAASPAAGPNVIASPATSGSEAASAASAASAESAAADAAEAEARRLPIYEAVESDWFGNRRKLPVGAAAAEGGWTTPADPGWDAARAAAAPASSETTTAGLPLRVPRANLVPGALGAPSDKPPIPRSASAVRDRLSGFQRGTSHGRAALNRDGEDQAP
jgi:signal transduction histidine kinase